MDSPDSSSSYKILATGAAGLSLVYLIRTYVTQKYKLKQYPPGPPVLPLLGNIREFPNLTKGETFDHAYLKLSKQYGLVFTFDVSLVLGTPCIIIADPALAKKIMVKQNPPKAFIYQELSPILGQEGLVVASGSGWARQRKLFNPGFASNFLKGMVTVFCQKLDRFLAKLDQDISENQVTHMLSLAQTYTSDVILAIAFGEEVTSTTTTSGKEQHPVRLYLNEATRLWAELLQNPIRRFVDVKTLWHLRRYGKLVDQEMLAILERRLASGTLEENAKDILSLAIAHMRQEQGDGPMTPQDKKSIVDQLKTFYFAGHDTTAIAISWVIWFLSQSSRVMEKVRHELEDKGIWKDGTNGVPPTFDDLQSCEYLEAVIKEALRLYPPATSLGRDGSDCEETWNGYSLKCKLLIVNVFVLHRHPSLWKEPDKFCPERFLDGSEDDLNNKYYAFSRGPRDCIGKHFAMLETKLAVSALVMKYDFQCMDPNEDFDYRITNVPRNGCQVKAMLRT